MLVTQPTVPIRIDAPPGSVQVAEVLCLRLLRVPLP